MWKTGVCALGLLLLLASCMPSDMPRRTAVPGTTSVPRPTVVVGDMQGVGLISGPFPGEAQSLNGAGATFPAALYTKWFNEYNKLTGVRINYQSIGSGGGIKSMQDGTVDFGATDGPMSDEQLLAARNGEILHIPMTLGAVVVTYNLPELKTPLKLTGALLGAIFMGDIKKWNDPNLSADNPELQSVDKNIVVVHRSDGSGTTFAFTDYLSSVSEAWKGRVGRGTAVNWPVGLGGKGNEGVAGEVKQNAYAIGYVELVYAAQNKLGVAEIRNRAGKWVTPSLESVTAAAAARAEDVPPDLRVSIVNAPGEKSYPISTYSWLLVYADQTDKAKAIALTRMLWWAVHDGQKFSADLAYAPLPESIVKKDEVKILTVNVNGERAFPAK